MTHNYILVKIDEYEYVSDYNRLLSLILYKRHRSIYIFIENKREFAKLSILLENF